MNCATFSASAPAPTSMFPPIAADCSTSGGPRPCWPSCKPHDETSPHVREHRLYLLARMLTEPPVGLLGGPFGGDGRIQNSDLVRPQQDIRCRYPRLLRPMSRLLLRVNDCVRKEVKRRSTADRK